MRRSFQNGLIGDIGLTKQEAHPIMSWAPRLKFLTNDMAPLSWLVLRKALLFGKNFLQKFGGNRGSHILPLQGCGSAVQDY